MIKGLSSSPIGILTPDSLTTSCSLFFLSFIRPNLGTSILISTPFPAWPEVTF